MSQLSTYASAELYAALLAVVAVACGLFQAGRWYQRRLDAAEWREAERESPGRHRRGPRQGRHRATLPPPGRVPLHVRRVILREREGIH
jgi:hypothetical protein